MSASYLCRYTLVVGQSGTACMPTHRPGSPASGRTSGSYTTHCVACQATNYQCLISADICRGQLCVYVSRCGGLEVAKAGATQTKELQLQKSRRACETLRCAFPARHGLLPGPGFGAPAAVHVRPGLLQQDDKTARLPRKVLVLGFTPSAARSAVARTLGGRHLVTAAARVSMLLSVTTEDDAIVNVNVRPPRTRAG